MEIEKKRKQLLEEWKNQKENHQNKSKINSQKRAQQNEQPIQQKYVSKPIQIVQRFKLRSSKNQKQSNLNLQSINQKQGNTFHQAKKAQKPHKQCDQQIKIPDEYLEVKIETPTISNLFQETEKINIKDEENYILPLQAQNEILKVDKATQYTPIIEHPQIVTQQVNIRGREGMKEGKQKRIQPNTQLNQRISQFEPQIQIPFEIKSRQTSGWGMDILDQFNAQISSNFVKQEEDCVGNGCLQDENNWNEVEVEQEDQQYSLMNNKEGVNFKEDEIENDLIFKNPYEIPHIQSEQFENNNNFQQNSITSQFKQNQIRIATPVDTSKAGFIKRGNEFNNFIGKDFNYESQDNIPPSPIQSEYSNSINENKNKNRRMSLLPVAPLQSRLKSIGLSKFSLKSTNPNASSSQPVSQLNTAPILSGICPINKQPIFKQDSPFNFYETPTKLIQCTQHKTQAIHQLNLTPDQLNTLFNQWLAEFTLKNGGSINIIQQNEIKNEEQQKQKISHIKRISLAKQRDDGEFDIWTGNSWERREFTEELIVIQSFFYATEESIVLIDEEQLAMELTERENDL